jgi:hypothetical protein
MKHACIPDFSQPVPVRITVSSKPVRRSAGRGAGLRCRGRQRQSLKKGHEIRPQDDCGYRPHEPHQERER